jgi:hypothetical protein
MDSNPALTCAAALTAYAIYRVLKIGSRDEDYPPGRILVLGTRKYSISYHLI